MLFKKNNTAAKEAESEELFNNPYIIDDETSESTSLDTNGKTPLLSQHSKDDSSFDSSYEEVEEPHSSTSTHFDLDIASDSIKEKNAEKESLLPSKPKKTPTPVAHPLQSTEEDEISILPPENEQTNGAANNNSQITEKEPAQVEAAKKAPVVIGGNDGVFANLSAKPQINKPTANSPPTIDAEMEDGPPNEPLPNYDQTMQEPSPPQFDNMTFIPMAADDVLVDHLPVGSIYAFLWSFIVSFMFEWVGFVLTYLLHINHSGRFGSFAGLGATLISTGIKVIINPDYFQPDGVGIHDNDDSMNDLKPDKEKVRSMMGYIMFAIGFMFVVKSFIGYHRVVKIRKEMLANNTLPL